MPMRSSHQQQVLRSGRPSDADYFAATGKITHRSECGHAGIGGRSAPDPAVSGMVRSVLFIVQGHETASRRT